MASLTPFCCHVTQDVTSVDYSAPAVEHMRRRNAASRPELRFEVGDARALQLQPAAYDLVLDKARPGCYGC